MYRIKNCEIIATLLWFFLSKQEHAIRASEILPFSSSNYGCSDSRIACLIIVVQVTVGMNRMSDHAPFSCLPKLDPEKKKSWLPIKFNASTNKRQEN